MKNKDITVIFAVSVVSAIFAFVISSQLLSNQSNLETSVEVVELVDPGFAKVDKRYFNEDSINPTQLIRVNENDNTNPFKPKAEENPATTEQNQ